MYKEHFGFKEPPFSIAPDPRFLYMSEQHREAMAHLVYGLRSDGGFVLLTGDVGTGKTTICRCLLEQLQDDTDIAFILNPRMSVEELLAAICDELAIAYPDGNVSVKVFVDRINAYLLGAFGRGRRTVLIIEEAQNLSPDVLEQVRLLTNLETNRQKLLKIVLIGQPQLREILLRPEMEQLSQRITARYHMGALSRDEVGPYVNHRVAVAGGRSGLFPEEVIGPLHRVSRGIPRLINVVCDRALLGAYTEGKQTIEKETLVRASREIIGVQGVQRVQRRRAAWLTGAVLVLVGAAAIGSGFYGKTPGGQPKQTAERLQGALLALEGSAPAAGEAGGDVPDSRRWTSGQSLEISRESAYLALLKEWDVSSGVRPNENVCRVAQSRGLHCLKESASFRELMNLDRPMVLKLVHDDGRAFYALLKRIEGRDAVLLVGEKTVRVGIDDLEKLWLGDYLLLWKPPESYKGSIYPGEKGPEVRWLEKQLLDWQGKSADRRKSLSYDKELVRLVRRFQLAEGIVPDGVAGPQTIIHLLNKKAAKGPSLRAQDRGGM